MKSVEKHIIKKSHDWYNYCTDITTTSRCLYNTVQYNQRQGYFYGHKFLNLSQLDKCFKDNENYKKLPAKVAQLVLKQNVDAWSAYYAAQDEYKQDSYKFTGKPKIPSFLVKRYNLIKFNNQAVGKKEFNKGFIVPSMSPLRIAVKPGMKFENICEVRIVPKVGCFVIEVVYEEQQAIEFTGLPNLAAAIDIGLDNLATVVFNDFNIHPLAINGKPLKSANKFYNKQVAKFKGFLPHQSLYTNRLNNITRNRNQFVDSYIHQSARYLVNKFLELGVSHVAIGKNEQWKTALNLGKKTNQSFTQIPHARFLQVLVYKLEQAGIAVTVGEESYTSIASFLDWDNIPTYRPNKKHSFSGRRLQRAWYVSKNGTKIHADINGAFNIGRKVIPNYFDCLQEQLKRDRGCLVVHPRRITPTFKREHASVSVA
ncbi:transposase [Aetokthonos hydrillicola Thurmond2011]|uniref:Transposase n=1 Tax=Aetokthonos hydrillicola Thurmond2011 TaxID=2712845 RepID=A0AAP5I944_9CYAN|nr:transposase [Aetokthonos hydrillicola]MDR9896939.1 transposase [Aetokthonos hydrillicola Thurmond2011]